MDAPSWLLVARQYLDCRPITAGCTAPLSAGASEGLRTGICQSDPKNLRSRRDGCFADNGGSMSPQAWKSASIKMFVQLGTFNERAVMLNFSANIALLAEECAGHADRGIPLPCGARLRQPTALCENYVPNHQSWLPLASSVRFPRCRSWRKRHPAPSSQSVALRCLSATVCQICRPPAEKRLSPLRPLMGNAVPQSLCLSSVARQMAACAPADSRLRSRIRASSQSRCWHGEGAALQLVLRPLGRRRSTGELCDDAV